MAYVKNELRYGYPDDDATNFGPVVSDDGPSDAMYSAVLRTLPATC